MIEIGRPFSKPYRDLIEAFEQRIRYGVEQPASERIIFNSGRTAYELRFTAYAITRVTGLVAGTTFTMFQPGVHYRLSNNRLIWLHDTEKPLDGGRLDVEYTYLERPAALTDFNPGSVIGTLVRAAAQEIKLLYDQMDEAYRRAFIDYAEGAALDNVVALLGIERNPAVAAKGEVTFYRKKAPDQRYIIPTGTRLSDEGERIFLTTAAGIIDADPINELTTHSSGVISVTNRIGELNGVWASGDDPEIDPPLATVDTEPSAEFGADKRTITLADPAAPLQLRVRYVATSVNVPIVAQTPGVEGNVNAETIVIMPTPPTGINGVINEQATRDGKPAEDDDQLRQRAKFHLERLGNATLNAIKYAVLEIDDVEGVEVADHSVDGSIPLGEIRVVYSGGTLAEVQEKVERTRAAGIIARYAPITELLISGRFYLLPAPVIPESAVATFNQRLIDSIDALTIGEPLSLRKLSALVYEVNGLADIAEAQLETDGTPLPELLLADKTQQIRADAGRIESILLTSLQVVGTPSHMGTTTAIVVRVLTEQGIASFNDFRLDLVLEFRARLSTAPEQLPSFIGSLARQIHIQADSSAEIQFEDSEIPGYRPAEYAPQLEISLSAKAYPGLQVAETQVDLS